MAYAPPLEHAAPALFEELRPPLDASEALLEADRCLDCRGPYAPAPCVVACPADVDVPTFVTQIAVGDAAAAAETIFAENLLGGTCARVCPVEVLCEGACVLAHEGRRPIAIAALQRFAAERALAQGLPLRPTPARRDGGRIAVVGAGPAGLAAAGELAARGHRVTVYDARPEVGGLVRFAIAPYRQRREPLPQEMRALAELGVDFRLHTEIDSPESLRRLEADADAILLAVGMGPDVDVGYPGDDLPGVWESLPFIEALKTGHLLEVGDRVVVIGGGNTAIDVAREAACLGALDVTVLYRRTEAEMPAYAHEVEEARAEGVGFRWLTVPVRFLGRERLVGVECRLMRLGKPDASGRPRPEEIPGSEVVLPADMAIKAIGQRPRAELLNWIEGLELDHGRLVVDPERGCTGNPHYFAAGDATNGGATVVEAVRDAKRAALGIDAAIRGERR